MALTPAGMGRPFGFGSGNGGPVVMPPNAGDPKAPNAARNLQLPLPAQFMIPTGQAFNPLGSIVTAAVQAGILIPGASVTIPDAMQAVISSVTIEITNMLTTTNVQFTVLVNKNPVQGYQNIAMFPRVAPFVGNTFDVPIYVDGLALVEVAFNNVDGGTYTVGAALSGWQWSDAADQLWKARGV